MASTRYDLDKEVLAVSYLQKSMEHQHQSGVALLQMARLAPGMTVFDFGCGTGNLTEAAAEIVGPTGKIIAIDPAGKRIELAKANIAKKNEGRKNEGQEPLTIDYYVGDAFSIVALLPAGTKVDVIYSNSVFHWLAPDQRPAAVASLERFLKPGGCFAIAGGSGDHPHMQDPKIEALSQHPFNQYPIQGEARFVKKVELQSIFSDLGYAEHLFDLRSKPVTFASVQAFLDWIEASTSGNFCYVDYLPEEYRMAALKEVVSRYEKMADPASGRIVFDSNILYSVATKA